MKQKEIISIVLFTFISLAVSTADMFFGMHTAKIIGSRAIGVLQLASSAHLFFLTLASSGYGLATLRLVSEDMATTFTLTKSIVKKCLSYSFLTGIVALTISIFSAKFISNNLLHIQTQPLIAMSASLPFVAMSTVLSGYFLAARQNLTISILQIFELLCRMLLVSLLLKSQKFDPCCAIPIVSSALDITAFLAMLAIYSVRTVHYNVKKCNLKKKIFSIALPIAISSYIRSGLSVFKKIITPTCLIKYGMTEESIINTYGLIHGMSIPVILFPANLLLALSTLLIPVIAKFHAKKEYYSISNYVSKSLTSTLLFAIGSAGTIFWFGEKIGEHVYKNAQVGTYIRILSLLIPVMYFDSITDALLQGLNKQTSIVKINIIDTLLTVILTLLLLPISGINGYITLIFISEILNAYLSIKKLYKCTQFSVDIVKCIWLPTFGLIVSILASSVTEIFTVNLTMNISVFVLTYLICCYPTLIRDWTKF